MNEPNSPTKTELYGWQIDRVMPDPANETKDIRCITILAARRIEDIWDWLAADRNDPRVEIVTLKRFGPIVAILDEAKP